MSPREVDTLRKEIKKRMIDLDLDRVGSYDVMLPHLQRTAGFTVSKSQLSMSLTGYRPKGKSPQILEALQRLLSFWPLDQENWPAFPV